MHRIGRTFVRLSTENRSRLDRFRRHQALSRDRLVNAILRDYLDTRSCSAEPRLRRRRAA